MDKSGDFAVKCRYCSGEGIVSPRSEDEGWVDEVCPVCDGEGWLWYEEDDKQS